MLYFSTHFARELVCSVLFHPTPKGVNTFTRFRPSQGLSDNLCLRNMAMSSCVPTVRGLRWALPMLLAIVFSLHPANTPRVWALDVPDVVATVQDQPIAAADLTAAVKGELLRLDMQRYKILKDGLDQLIAEQLTKLEAEKRQQSPEQLLQEEVTAKVLPVTPEQV